MEYYMKLLKISPFFSNFKYKNDILNGYTNFANKIKNTI